jgi:hypothetical protein
MKIKILFIIFWCCVVNSFAATLGNYNPATVTANGNLIITPSALPTGVTTLSVATSTKFKGILTGDPATGNIRVTDAYPAGVYTVNINGNGASASFTLTVSIPVCSQGYFFNTSTVTAQTTPSYVAVGDINNDGKQDILVANSASNSVSVRLGAGNGTFTGSTNITVGSAPACIVIADFNRDGKQDFVTANTNSNNISIGIGNGLGSFSVTTSNVGGGPTFLAVADLDNNSIYDLAVVNGSSNTISILLGTGSGSFTAQPVVSTNTGPRTLTIADFNGDLKQDIAVTTITTGVINIRLGNGLGGFSNGTSISTANIFAISSADINNDNIVDLIYGSGSNVEVRTGLGNGTFNAPVDEFIPSTCRNILISDFNGDGKQDVAAAIPDSNYVLIMLGNGTGSLVTTSALLSTNSYCVAGGDFNADGLTDVASVNNNATLVKIYCGVDAEINLTANGINIPDGNVSTSAGNNTLIGQTSVGFPNTKTYSIQNLDSGPLSISAINISGASASEFQVSGIYFPVFLETGAIANFNVTFNPVTNGTKDITIHIINDDCNESDYDFNVRGISGTPSLGTYANALTMEGGNATVTPAFPASNVLLSVNASPIFTGMITVDTAGKVYITKASPIGNFLITITGGSMTRTFSLQVDTPLCSPASFVRKADVSSTFQTVPLLVADINNDNIQDLISSVNNNSFAYVKKGLGNGTFIDIDTLDTGPGSAWNIIVADINRDGFQDIILSLGYYGLSIYLNNNGVSFSPAINYNMGFYVYDCAVADFNGDGFQDLALGTNTGFNVMLNDGFGNFTTSATVGSGAIKVIVADYNKDGKPDLASTYSNDVIQVSFGNGSGGFSPVVQTTVANSIYDFAVVDINHDSIPDLLTVGSGYLMKCIGTGTGTFTPIVLRSAFYFGNISLADLNGDGIEDVLTEGNYLLGNANGTFDSPVVYLNNQGFNDIAVGDFNSDGRADIALSTYQPGSISIFEGGSVPLEVYGKGISIINNTLTTSASNQTDFGSIALGVTESSAFILKNPGADSVIINSINFTGASSSEFSFTGITFPLLLRGQDSIQFFIHCNPLSVGNKSCTININNSQCLTSNFSFALSANAVAPSIGTYMNVTMWAGSDSISYPNPFNPGHNNFTISTSPAFRGTLYIDGNSGGVRIINAEPPGIYTVNIHGAGNLTASFTLTVNDPLCSQAAFKYAGRVANPGSYHFSYGDFNNDSHSDFIGLAYASNSNTTPCTVNFGDGTGQFNQSLTTTINYTIYNIELGDFNSDGNLDFVSNTDSAIIIFTGDGSGRFFEYKKILLSNYIGQLLVADVNSDGRPDLAVTLGSQSAVYFYINTGNGNFTQNIRTTGTLGILLTSDFNNDGYMDFAMASSDSLEIWKGTANNQFVRASTIFHSFSYNLSNLVAADFNNDGNTDIAFVSNFSTASFLQIFLGNGTGNFVSVNATAIDNSAGTSNLETGDFNGDGYDDLLFILYSSHKVNVLLGKGDGTFPQKNEVSVFRYIYDLLVADFNGDKILDFACATTNYNSPGVELEFGKKSGLQILGNGSEVVRGSTTTSLNNQTDFGTVSTLNSISKTFRLVNKGTDSVSISSITFTGANSANFSVSGVSLPYLFTDTGSLFFNIICTSSVAGIKSATVHINYSDCNAGDYDFAISATSSAVTIPNYPLTTIPVGTNTTISPITGTGGITNLSVYTTPFFKGILNINHTTGVIRVTNAGPAGVYPVTVKYGTNSNTFTLNVTHAGCGATLTAGTQIATGNSPNSTTVLDFNQDGKQDIAIARMYENAANTIEIKFGNGSGGFPTSFNITTGSAISSIEAGDFNNDGNQDIAAAYYNQNKIVISYGNGSGGVSTSSTLNLFSHPSDIETADLNGDGFLDLVISTSTGVGIYSGSSSGTFTSVLGNFMNSGGGRVDLGELNGDGKIDILYSDPTSTYSLYKFGNGDGTFYGGIYLSGFYPQLGVAIGDLDQDGMNEIIAAQPNGNFLPIGLNDGEGFFGNSSSVFYQASDVAFADLTGDGNPDLLAVGQNTANCMVHVTPIGQNYSTVPILNGATQITTGEFNGDGITDIVFTSSNNNNVAINFGVATNYNLKGNGIIIPDGNNSTSTTNYTDYGTLANQGTTTRDYVVENNGYSKVFLDSIRFTGPGAAYFVLDTVNTVINTIDKNSSQYYTIRFVGSSVAGVYDCIAHFYLRNCSTTDHDFALKATVNPGPSLGNYSNLTIPISADSIVLPNAAPNSATGVFVLTDSRFKGLLTVDPVSGLVRITNAYPAGTYIVKVGADNIPSKTFTLTVTSASCAAAVFNSTTLPTGSNPIAVVIGDFNNDGIQDMAAAENGTGNISVRLGNGTGFNSATNAPGGLNPTALATGDFNRDGKQDLLLALGSLNVLSMKLGNGNGTFNPATSVSTGNNPVSITTGDFNNDGKTDWAVAAANSNSINVYLGDGAGNYTQPGDITTLSNPRGVVTGDFNNDGNQDLAFACQTASSIIVRFGNGTGQFPTYNQFSTPGQPQSLVAADFNGDSNMDLAYGVFNSFISYVRLGNASGSFSATSDINISTGTSVKSLSTGDFNGDGIIDLLTANNSTNDVSVFGGNGNGTFNGLNGISAGTAPVSIVTGDINRDGKQDFIVANQGSNNVMLFTATYPGLAVTGNLVAINDGSIATSASNNTNFGQTFNGFPVQKSFSINNNNRSNLSVNTITITGPNAANFSIQGTPVLPSQLSALGSMNFNILFTPSATTGAYSATIHVNSQDCVKPDYDFVVQANVVQNPLGTYPNVILNSGANGNVTPSAAPASLSSLTAITSPAFKGIITANPVSGVVRITNAYPAGNYTLTLKNNSVTLGSFSLTVNEAACSPGKFGTATSISGSGSDFVSVGDFNNDNIQDLLICNYSANNISIKLGNGSGGFSGSTTVNITNPFAATIADFNGDGNQDFVVTSSLTTNATICLGNGTGGFPTTTNIAVGNDPAIVVAGDINNDGNMDLAIANPANVNIRLGNGAGGFTSAANIIGGTPYSLAFTDVNADQNLDLVIASNYSGALKLGVATGNGNGNFNGPSPVSITGTNLRSVVVNDFNEDGLSDIFTVNNGTNDYAAFALNNFGQFSFASTGSTGTQPSYVASADFDGNGFMDVIYANTGSNTIQSRAGNGNANFQSAVTCGTGNGPQCIAVGDFNGDGIHDIATAYKVGNTTGIQLGLKNGIALSGNGITIDEGSITPSLSNNTNFGSVQLSSNTVKTYQIFNNSSASITISSIQISGTNASEFAVSGINLPVTLTSGNSTTLTITFTPTVIGNRSASVQLTTSFCTSYSFNYAISGTGTCVQPAFQTCPVSFNVTASANRCSSVANYIVTLIPNSNAPLTYQFTGATTGSGAGSGTGSTFNMGVTQVIVTASDACGTASCTFNITVNATLSDNNICTTDVCDVNGVVTHTQINFDDNNACTNDVCDPVNGPSHLPVNTNDNNACTIDGCDQQTGVTHSAVVTDDSNVCTTDGCDIVTGIYHTAVNVDDQNICTNDGCDPVNGPTHTPVGVDDNNPCTNDGCNPATGIFHHPVNVDDNNLCTADQCNQQTGVISHTILNVNDNNICTIDICDPVFGIFHIPVNTNDNNACTADACDSLLGVYHYPAVEICGNGIDDDCDGQVDEDCLAFLHLHLFIEGYYLGSGQMVSAINPLNPGAECDTLGIELHESFYPYNAVYLDTSILDISGDVDFSFPTTVLGHNYYLAVRHRNALETWSSAPVVFSSRNIFYSFTDHAYKAYGSNQADMGDGNFAFWSGDISDAATMTIGLQDGIIESQDYLDMENAVYLIYVGYNYEDLTGDGVVEESDYIIIENNVRAILFTMRP